MRNDSNNHANDNTRSGGSNVTDNTDNCVDRRTFLRLASLGLGGVIYACGLNGWAQAVGPAQDFFFVQLSDSHWGFEGDVNPDAKGTLKKAVATVNSLEQFKVTARRFDFSPSVIQLKKGVPVVFELTSLDITMGFSAPDFGVRSDVLPGVVSRLRLVPDKAGEFTFYCDIFCGSGHESMSGALVVA